MCHKIWSYIEQKKGNCEVYPAPFDVWLKKESKNKVEPDISVICDPDKITAKGCEGAPDWIIEKLNDLTLAALRFPGITPQGRRDYGAPLPSVFETHREQVLDRG